MRVLRTLVFGVPLSLLAWAQPVSADTIGYQVALQIYATGETDSLGMDGAALVLTGSVTFNPSNSFGLSVPITLPVRDAYGHISAATNTEMNGSYSALWGVPEMSFRPDGTMTLILWWMQTPEGPLQLFAPRLQTNAETDNYLPFRFSEAELIGGDFLDRPFLGEYAFRLTEAHSVGVPEPSSLAFVGIGGIAAVFRRRRRRGLA